MGIKGEPVITKCKDGENGTRITFAPDLPKFNMTELEDDVVALMKKRVVDLAGTLGKTVKVELNGQKLPVKTFQQYVDLYLKSADKNKAESLPRFAYSSSLHFIHLQVNSLYSFSDQVFCRIGYMKLRTGGRFVSRLVKDSSNR